MGSPGTDDSFNDSIADYQANEVALDYNAGLVGALARMYSAYGGTPLADESFPLPDTAYSCRNEYGAFFDLYSDNATGLSASVFLENRSGWPARVSDQLKFRYYFTLDAADVSDITTTLGTAPAGTKISAPTVYDAARRIYYVTVDATGTKIFPGYAYGLAGPEIRFTIGSRSSRWSSANDWSARWDATYTGGYGGHDYAPNVPVYEGAAASKLCGNEPA